MNVYEISSNDNIISTTNQKTSSYRRDLCFKKSNFQRKVILQGFLKASPKKKNLCINFTNRNLIVKPQTLFERTIRLVSSFTVVISVYHAVIMGFQD